MNRPPRTKKRVVTNGYTIESKACFKYRNPFPWRGWLIQHVDIAKWGTEVVVQAIFEPDLTLSIPNRTSPAVAWATGLYHLSRIMSVIFEADVIGFDIDDEA